MKEVFSSLRYRANPDILAYWTLQNIDSDNKLYESVNDYVIDLDDYDRAYTQSLVYEAGQYLSSSGGSYVTDCEIGFINIEGNCY